MPGSVSIRYRPQSGCVESLGLQAVKALLAGVAGEGNGPIELRAGRFVAAEPAEQGGPDRGQLGIALQGWVVCELVDARGTQGVRAPLR
jgi:hypothetical protein